MKRFRLEPRRFVPVVLAVVMLGALSSWWLLHDPNAPALTSTAEQATADYDYVIPAGTAERLDRGEDVTIIPDSLTVKVGEVIRIRNDDVRGQLVGPFFIGAGETLTQRFSAPGQLSGACQIHRSGQFVITIVPA